MSISRQTALAIINEIITNLLQGINKKTHKTLLINGMCKKRKIWIFWNSEWSLSRAVMLLSFIKVSQSCLQRDCFCTTRDIYYRDVATFVTQDRLVRLLKRFCRALSICLEDLKIVGSAKGLIWGDVSVECGGGVVDCRNVSLIDWTGSFTIHPKNIHSLLVVEKDTVFQHLVNHGFRTKFPRTILITGKGYPDKRTATLIRLLVEGLNIPCFLLVDGDPYGIEIYLTYKYKAAGGNHGVQWLGLWPSELEKLNISSRLELAQNDLRKIEGLVRRAGDLRDEQQLQCELAVLKRTGFKAEIESLYDIHQQFLVDFYLPSKLGDV